MNDHSLNKMGPRVVTLWHSVWMIMLRNGMCFRNLGYVPLSCLPLYFITSPAYLCNKTPSMLSCCRYYVPFLVSPNMVNHLTMHFVWTSQCTIYPLFSITNSKASSFHNTHTHTNPLSQKRQPAFIRNTI